MEGQEIRFFCLLFCLYSLIGSNIENLEKLLSAWTLCLFFLARIRRFTKSQEEKQKWNMRILKQAKYAISIHSRALLRRVLTKKKRLKWLGNCKTFPKKTIWACAVPYFCPDQDDRLRTYEGRLETSTLSQEHAHTLAQNGFWFINESGKVKCFSCGSRHNAKPMTDHPDNLYQLHSQMCQHRIQYGQMLTIPHQTPQPDTGQIHRKIHETVYPTSETTKCNKQQEETATCFELSTNVPTERQIVAEVNSSTDVLYQRETTPSCTPGTQQDESASRIQSSENTDMLFAGASDKGSETRASNSKLSENTSSLDQETTNVPRRNTSITHGAGLFYKGHGDIVKCISCGGEVRICQHGMDPREEHNKLYPNCAFLAEQKKERLLNQKEQDGVLLNEVQAISQEQALSDEIGDYEGTPAEKSNSNLGQPIHFDDRICRSCGCRKSNVLFEPCMHVICCDICAPIVTKCMSCQMRIQAKGKVYL